MLVFGGVHLFDNHGFNLPFGWSFGDVFNFSSSKKTKAATTHTPRKLTWNLKMMLSKRDLLFKRGSLPSLGEPTVVSFGECTSIDALLQLKKKSVNNTEKWGQCTCLNVCTYFCCKKLVTPLKNDGWKTTFLFEFRPIFRGYLKCPRSRNA